jgi:hypothetical protein
VQADNLQTGLPQVIVAMITSNAGKHIISVKPMAMDVAGADAIVAAVRSAGVTYLLFESSHRLIDKELAPPCYKWE